MYPRISDFINDVFGTNMELPIQSYGFFLALAFITAGFLLRSEIKRKELVGDVMPTRKKVTIGKPASITELVITFLLSLVIGYKFIGIFIHYQAFSDNPQEFLFSSEGCMLGGILFAIAVTAYQFYIKDKKKLDEPKIEEIVVPAKDQMWPIVFIAVIFGIVGAKIFHQFENWDAFIADPMGSLFSFSGLTFYGGLIVANVHSYHGLPLMMETVGIRGQVCLFG